MDIDFIIKKVKFLYASQGILGPVNALGRKIYYYGFTIPRNAALFPWAVMVRRQRFPEFTFQGKQYPYLYKFKNFAWTTERSVEVSLVAPYLREAYGEKRKILEIGEVVRQFSEFKTHDILDKYEYKKGIINTDIADFKPDEKYDLIVSVSTMEHVGWDAPEERDPEKMPYSLGLIKGWLAPNGVAVVTMPIGYNDELDKRLRARTMPFTEEYFMQRVSEDNRWEEATRDEALGRKYGSPFPAANAIVIGVIRNEA